MPLPRLRPPAESARAGAQRSLRVLCLWCLGLYGHGRGGVGGGAAAPDRLAEAPGPPAALHTPSPVTTTAFQAASGSRQAALRRSPSTVCVCPSAVRPCPTARRVPGCPTGEPWRGVP